MTNLKLGTLEAISVVLAIFIAHTIVSLPRTLLVSTKSATIINLLYVGIIVILLTLLVVRLLKNFSSSDIIDVSEYLGGHVFKKIVGIVFIFYFIFSVCVLLRNFCECLKVVYYPMTNIIFILLVFIIAICIVNRFRFESTSKVNLVIFPFVLFSMLFIFLSNITNFSLDNIYPILGDGIFNTFVTGLGNLGAFGGIAILYFLPPYLKNPEDFKKISIISVGIAIIYIILCVSTILFMFTFLIQVDEIMPLYSAARYIEFGSFFERVESALLLIWILQIACYLSIVLHICMSIFKKISNLESTKELILPFGLLVFGISLLPNNYAFSKFLENQIYPYLVIGVGFFLGIALLVLAHFKKRKKEKMINEKNI